MLLKIYHSTYTYQVYKRQLPKPLTQCFLRKHRLTTESQISTAQIYFLNPVLKLGKYQFKFLVCHSYLPIRSSLKLIHTFIFTNDHLQFSNYSFHSIFLMYQSQFFRTIAIQNYSVPLNFFAPPLSLHHTFINGNLTLLSQLQFLRLYINHRSTRVVRRPPTYLLYINFEYFVHSQLRKDSSFIVSNRPQFWIFFNVLQVFSNAFSSCLCFVFFHC